MVINGMGKSQEAHGKQRLESFSKKRNSKWGKVVEEKVREVKRIERL